MQAILEAKSKAIGTCRQCSSALAVVTGGEKDRITGKPILGRDGKPVYRSRVQCGNCGLPHPEHPLQREIDEKTALRQLEQEEIQRLQVEAQKINPVSKGVQTVGEWQALSEQFERLLTRVEAQDRRIAVLEDLVHGKKKKSA